MSSNVGEIRDPNFTWSCGRKFSIQNIGGNWIVMFGISRHFEFSSPSGLYSGCSHNPGNPWSGAFLALSMKFLSDPWTTIGTLAIFKNIQNINQKAFILLPAIRRSIPKPCIVAAFTYFKNLTHHLNRKFYAVINHHLRSLLALKVNYRVDDILVAVRRAKKHKVFEPSAIESFLENNSEPRYSIKLSFKPNNNGYDEQ